MAIALTCPVRADAPGLWDLVVSVAERQSRPTRALHLQALLQLPRLAGPRGDVVFAEAAELVEELAAELPKWPAWRAGVGGTRVRELRFQEVEDETAARVLRSFHYLRSPRRGGRAYALSSPSGELVALCVSSPLDVAHLQSLLTQGGHSTEVTRVFSRVFAFDDAPDNTLSFLLSKACRAERSRGVKDVMTYVNPNMGFGGSSYRASGWRLLGEEPGTRYRYLDGRYITDRELAAMIGPLDDDQYRRVLGVRFAASVMPLAPLRVFHRRLA